MPKHTGLLRGGRADLWNSAVRISRGRPHPWRRSDLVITTKIFWGGSGVNERGLSRKHIMEGMDSSLSVWGWNTSTWYSVTDLILTLQPPPWSSHDGHCKVRAPHHGEQEWSAQQITEAFWIARTEGLEPPSTNNHNITCFTDFVSNLSIFHCLGRHIP